MIFYSMILTLQNRFLLANLDHTLSISNLSFIYFDDPCWHWGTFHLSLIRYMGDLRMTVGAEHPDKVSLEAGFINCFIHAFYLWLYVIHWIVWIAKYIACAYCITTSISGSVTDSFALFIWCYYLLWMYIWLRFIINLISGF